MRRRGDRDYASARVQRVPRGSDARSSTVHAQLVVRPVSGRVRRASRPCRRRPGRVRVRGSASAPVCRSPHRSAPRSRSASRRRSAGRSRPSRAGHWRRRGQPPERHSVCRLAAQRPRRARALPGRGPSASGPRSPRRAGARPGRHSQRACTRLARRSPASRRRPPGTAGRPRSVDHDHASSLQATMCIGGVLPRRARLLQKPWIRPRPRGGLRIWIRRHERAAARRRQAAQAFEQAGRGGSGATDACRAVQQHGPRRRVSSRPRDSMPAPEGLNVLSARPEVAHRQMQPARAGVLAAHRGVVGRSERRQLVARREGRRSRPAGPARLSATKVLQTLDAAGHRVQPAACRARWGQDDGGERAWAVQWAGWRAY